MRSTSALLRSIATDGYVSIDFDPAADGRLVDLAASLTNLPLGDQSVGLLVCMHVLEHVPDDRAAMTEIARCLAPGGIALVQVPWRPGPTDEDPTAGPAERVARFGQIDHVRYYGDDFEDRLREAGLRVDQITPAMLLSPEATTLFGLIPVEPFWLLTSAMTEPRTSDILAPLIALREALPAAIISAMRRSTEWVLTHRPAPTVQVARRSLPRRLARRAKARLRGR